MDTAVAALAHQKLGEKELAKTHLADTTKAINVALARREDGTLDPSYLMRTQQIRHDLLIAEWIRQQADRSQP